MSNGGSGTSVRMRSSSRLWRARSAWAVRASRYLRCGSAGAASSSRSSVPWVAISSRAPFSPMPGTPFTLSMASPISASVSTTCPGSTPKRSLTPAASYQVPSSRGLKTVISSPTSWKKSLSPVMIATGCPPAAARTASVPITSSASKPG